MGAPDVKTALVLGIGGQDATYLAQFLLGQGYRVVGTSRDATLTNRAGLRALGIESQVSIVSMALADKHSVVQTLRRYAPDEIYQLAALTSVGLSFDQPVETIESIVIGTLNVLEAIRVVGRPMRLYHAGSSECFGDTGEVPANEATPFRPRSPYAVAKACAHDLVATYRDAYGMHACTGILFNHESPLRTERFVTQRIVLGAARIAAGDSTPLRLGNLDVHRDWGWAPEYVQAMWRMVQQDTPEDLLIATGRTVSLSYFVERAFATFGLDAAEHVQADTDRLRPTDIRYSAADPSRAFERIAWKATVDVDGVIDRLCRHARAVFAESAPSSRI